MAKASGVDTSGVSASLKKMAALASEAEMKLALTSGANVILTQAKINTPVMTGNLRRSEAVSGFKYKSGKASIDVGTSVEYAPYVEFGTIHQTAQPYLRPAFDEKKGEALRMVEASLKKLLGDIIG